MTSIAMACSPGVPGKVLAEAASPADYKALAQILRTESSISWCSTGRQTQHHTDRSGKAGLTAEKTDAGR